MFEQLGDRLQGTLKKLRGQARLTEANIADAMREVRIALLEADVSLPVVKSFVGKVKEKAVGVDVSKSLNPGQMVVKIVQDELVQLMGAANDALNLAQTPPAVILVAGLQGAGKTTTVGKLANLLKQREGKRVMVVSADIYRPAAIEQLKTLADSIDVTFCPSSAAQKAVDIVANAKQAAKNAVMDVLIIDTAGRLHVDSELMQEIKAVHAAANPIETLFVVDSMTGQDAVNTAKAFNDILNFDGVILTKLDGDTRGGAAISIKSVVDKPIKFIGTGEKMDAIDVFYPSRMAERILGMGDVVSLVERAQEQFDEEEARKLQKKIAKNQFNFNDFLKQIQQIKKMGNVKDLMGMIPGVGKAIKDADIDDDAFKGIEAIIFSMTPLERENPKVLNGSRRKRIAKGAGTDIQEVNRLIKQFAETSKMMKMMTSGGGRKMANMMNQLKK